MMKYNDFKKMVAYIKAETDKYCNGIKPTQDEIESLAVMLYGMVRYRFIIRAGNYNHFRIAIRNTIQNEILRVCA